jgi:hypothetical protein
MNCSKAYQGVGDEKDTETVDDEKLAESPKV